MLTLMRALATLSATRTLFLSLTMAMMILALGGDAFASQPWTCDSCFYVYCSNPPACETCGVWESWDTFYYNGYCMMRGEGRCIYMGDAGGPCAQCDQRWMQECLICGQ
ncbi:MAG: hypothetical protein AB7U25_11545 [Vicinamibacterales bacterium]